ncbi:hypothetical protein D187_000073 [Cystobacter fuscus DSM 2262]|uniref:Uncharacterized protein n=1 Tax=Cystobacter fuscus (strain ATCC 25194 / DSM 2262 / NBRC 100088 / M29) TaxID=1242864 RepID=S9PNS8_CYSF2|nr:hypothetical protein D187_000073 [Cystobacter fuscus DSM 2262]
MSTENHHAPSRSVGPRRPSPPRPGSRQTASEPKSEGAAPR